jgi:hypothetical protein
MGLIAKQQTKRLVAPVRFVTTLPRARILDYFTALTKADKSLVGLLAKSKFGYFEMKRPEGADLRIALGKQSLDPRMPNIRISWIFTVGIDDQTSNDETLVTLQLVKWKTRDGKLDEKQNYIKLREDVLQHFKNLDPTLRILE